MSAETATRPTSHQTLIEGLNHALNREVSTFLRYMLQAASLKGVHWAPLRDIYQREVSDELGHAQYLANKIVMLGGTPALAPDLTPPPTDPHDMLQQDIEQERMDVQGYKELAQLAEDAGLIELKLQMEEQAADEARHAELLTRLQG